MSGQTPAVWPEKPYRGLNYFRPEDRALLAGREADVASCAELLANPETRVLLLHGSTGCGKSSFLRAGLIPELEEQGAGHLFLRDTEDDNEALFIRCTAAPIDQIARQVFLFASRPFRLRTPSGERIINLKRALLGSDGWETYLAATREPPGLVGSLHSIAEAIPQTLVLIVDQAEEVLTLNPGEEGFQNRAQFFAFLRDFQRLQFDARILVALRTEYLGRFLDAVQISYRSATGFMHFFLSELQPEALKEAIERPTLREEVPPWGIPYDTYGFEFDKGLVKRIVRDVQAAKYSGPALPVLQLVCLGLWEQRSRKNLISTADYEKKSGVEGQILAHVQREMAWALTPETEKVSVRLGTERRELREFLGTFYNMQDDGTVVARTRSLDWALQTLTRHMPTPDAEVLLNHLVTPQTMILRLLRNVKPDGAIATEVTLAHDFIALAVERWRALEAEARAAEHQRREKAKLKFAFILYLVYVLIAIMFSIFSLKTREDLLGIVVDSYAIISNSIGNMANYIGIGGFLNKMLSGLIAAVGTTFGTVLLFFIAPLGVCLWIVEGASKITDLYKNMVHGVGLAYTRRNSRAHNRPDLGPHSPSP